MMKHSEYVNPSLAINMDSREYRLSRAGQNMTFYGLVLVSGWIGMMKFTSYEATAIEGLISSSPFLSWIYLIFDQEEAARLIGIVEIAAAVLLASRPWLPTAAAAGALLMVSTTTATLTFLFTAPGWEASLGGFPALSVVPGQFLIKDLVLLGASIWLLGEILKETRTP